MKISLAVPDRAALDRIRHSGFWPRLMTVMNDRSMEWFSALAMTSWGLTLMLPGDTLHGPQYMAFARFGFTEDFWTFAFTGFGVARLAALYINGKWPKSPHIRIVCALFGVVSWSQISSLLAGGQTPAWNTGVGVYALFAAADALAIVRAAFDARYYDR